MLYNTSLEMDKVMSTEDIDYIFDTEIYNEDINISDIAVLENFFNKRGYLPIQYIELFLNYITFYARKNVTEPLENALKTSYKGRCATTANINRDLLNKMGFETKEFNVGDVFGTEHIHQLCIVSIPTLVNGEIIKKQYVLDPTFRQFCIAEENRFERYFEEERYSVRRATPHPGYFLKLHDIGTKLAQHIIRYGYFEATPENIKVYLDSYYFYLKKKEDYSRPDNIGTEYVSPISGQEYFNTIMENVTKYHFPSRIPVITPMKRIAIERSKLRYKLKQFFTGVDEYESKLDLDSDDTTIKL